MYFLTRTPVTPHADFDKRDNVSVEISFAMTGLPSYSPLQDAPEWSPCRIVLDPSGRCGCRSATDVQQNIGYKRRTYPRLPPMVRCGKRASKRDCRQCTPARISLVVVRMVRNVMGGNPRRAEGLGQAELVPVRVSGTLQYCACACVDVEQN